MGTGKTKADDDLSHKRTDYQNDSQLREIATTIYQVESGRSSHYESIRTTATSFNAALTGALVALSDRIGSGVIGVCLMLGLLGIFWMIVAHRLGQAHGYHWYLATKMRQVIVRGHPKVVEKYKYVNDHYVETVGIWRMFGHENMWTIMNLFIPIIGAAVLYFVFG